MYRHMCLSIAGALKFKQFKGFTSNGRNLSEKQARQCLIMLQDKGHKYMPLGTCDNFDPFEKGCQGHEGTPKER